LYIQATKILPRFHSWLMTFETKVNKEIELGKTRAVIQERWKTRGFWDVDTLEVGGREESGSKVGREESGREESGNKGGSASQENDFTETKSAEVDFSLRPEHRTLKRITFCQAAPLKNLIRTTEKVAVEELAEEDLGLNEQNLKEPLVDEQNHCHQSGSVAPSPQSVSTSTSTSTTSRSSPLEAATRCFPTWNASKLFDLVRGMIVCETMNDLFFVVDCLKRCPDIEILRVKNRMNETAEGGWADFMVKILWGIINEASEGG
jgi:hypothetical protein